MRQSHLILSNAAVMWTARVLLLVPQLILVPFLISTIGESGYGVYALVWSLMMSIEQLQMSLQSGVVKYSAAFLAKGQMTEVNKVVSSSFIYSILLAILACAGILLAATFYNDSTGQIASSLVVVGIMILFIFPLTPYVAVIQSRQCYYVGAIAETVSKYISLLIVVIWFKMMGPSVEAVVVIMAGMLLLSRIAQVPVAYHMVTELQNRPSAFDWKSFRQIASFGAVIVLASLCIAVNSTGIRWLMAALASTRFVTHLAIMLMPGLFLSQIIGAVTITVMPATSAYEATGNQWMLQELLIRGMRYTTILVLAGLLAASLLMRYVLAVWVGVEYEFLAPYALVLFASISFMLSTSTGHHMLRGMGKLRAIVIIYWFGLVIVPIGLILVVFLMSHNPYIAVTAGLAAGHLVCGCLQISSCTKAVHTDLRSVFMRVYMQPFLVGTAVYLFVFGIVTTSGITSLIGRACVSFLAVLLLFSGCYFFIATPEERQQVAELIQLVKRKIAPKKGMPEVN